MVLKFDCFIRRDRLFLQRFALWCAESITFKRRLYFRLINRLELNSLVGFEHFVKSLIHTEFLALLSHGEDRLL